MKKIVLLCSAGASTGMLVVKMEEAAKKDNYECVINAYSITEAATVGQDADVILLGPQVGYRLEKVKEICPNTKVEVIDMMDYGMMNGEKVLNHVKEMLGE